MKRDLVASYRAAVTPGAEDLAEGVRLGALWALRQQAELGGEILIQLPQMNVLDEHPGLVELSNRLGVNVGTRRNGHRSGQIVLAAWPGRLRRNRPVCAPLGCVPASMAVTSTPAGLG